MHMFDSLRLFLSIFKYFFLYKTEVHLLHNGACLTFWKVKRFFRLKPDTSLRIQTNRFLFYCKCLLQFTSNFTLTWTFETKRKITNTGSLVLHCTIQIELSLILKSITKVCLCNLLTFGSTYELYSLITAHKSN